MEFLILTLVSGGIGILVIAAGALVVTHYIRKGKRFMRDVFGTDNVAQLAAERELLEENTPKSVSGLTSIYAPMIQRDFPELNWMELRTKAENHLVDFLMNKGYYAIKIHQTEIREYVKESGTCTIIFQSGVEYKIKEKKVQARYNIHMIYIQDLDKYQKFTGLGLNCPNCGGALSSLGDKSCPYCGTRVIPINMNVWELDKIVES